MPVSIGRRNFLSARGGLSPRRRQLTSHHHPQVTRSTDSRFTHSAALTTRHNDGLPHGMGAVGVRSAGLGPGREHAAPPTCAQELAQEELCTTQVRYYPSRARAIPSIGTQARRASVADRAEQDGMWMYHIHDNLVWRANTIFATQAIDNIFDLICSQAHNHICSSQACSSCPFFTSTEA